MQGKSCWFYDVQNEPSSPLKFQVPQWVQVHAVIDFIFSSFQILIRNSDRWLNKHVKINLIIVLWISKIEISWKIAKKVDFRKILDPIWDLVLKRVSKFVIPKFRDTLLVPKITKCEDLLYNRSECPDQKVEEFDL